MPGALINKGLTPGFDAAAAGAKWEGRELARVTRLKARGKKGFGQRGDPGKFFNPSSEAREASSQRRKAQAVQRDSKPYIRHPYPAPGWKDHVRRGPVISLAATGAVGGVAAVEAHRSNVRKGAAGTLRRVVAANESQIRNAVTTSAIGVGGGAAIGAGVGLAHSRKRKRIAKFDRKEVTNAALGGVVGSSAATGANLVGGQAVKAGLKIHRAKVGTSQKDAEIWAGHKAKYGVRGKTHRTVPNKTLVAIHEHYPKELPGWRVQRALGFKNRTSTRMGTKVAGAVVGAELVHHHYQQKALSKLATEQSIRHRKNVAAALGTTSAVIGLGTLGAKGGQGVLRRVGKARPWAAKAAGQIQRHTQSALIIGTGVGSAGALNSAVINRAEAKGRIRKGLPTHGYIPKIGRVRVMHQHSKDHFMVLDKSDTRRLVHRNQITFVKPSKKEGLGKGAPMPVSKAVPQLAAPPKGTAAKVKNAVVAPVSNTKGVLNQISTATSGTPMFTKPKLSKSFARDVKTGVSEGYKLSGAPGATIRHAVKQPAARAGLQAGYSTGSHAQSFSAGFSRKQPSLEALQSGSHTTKANAVHPNSFKAGTLTRKVGVPVAVVGGGYKAGKAYGAHRERKKLQKGLEMVAKAYGYDPEHNRHRRAGFYSGAANLGGATLGGVAAHQGVKSVKSGRTAVKSFKSIAEATGAGSAGTMRAAHKLTEASGTAALKHGGKAAGAAVAGGTLVAVGRKIKRKQTQADWRSYRGY